MKLFWGRRRSRDTLVRAVVKGDAAAALAWRVDLRVRLDAELSRATSVTLAAAESWATLDDPPPKDDYLAQALRDADLWGHELKPGTHIDRWSEEDGTVTIRAWARDLARPLSDGGHAPMSRERTIPWPGRPDQAHAVPPEGDEEVLADD